MKSFRGILPVFFSAILLTSCGYNFPGVATALPGGGTKIALEPFANATEEPGLVTGIQEAFSLEVAKRGSFEQTSAGRADVVLSGVVQSLDVRPVGFSRSDEAFQQSDSYGAAATTVIAQSSEFQESSTLNEADLLRLSDVQVAESQQGDALRKVSENLARELYNSMVDNF